MKNANPVGAYRESVVEGANPVELVLMLYDAAVASLQRAVRAMEANDIEERTARLNHVLDVVGELQASLEFVRGGEVARSLARFYNMVRAKVVEANGKGSKEILAQLIRQLLSVREALQQAAASSASPEDKAGENLSSAAPSPEIAPAAGPPSSRWRA